MSWESKINVVRGKNLVGKATPQDVAVLLKFIDIVERALDEADADDTFGTEGWRHSVLGED